MFQFNSDFYLLFRPAEKYFLSFATLKKKTTTNAREGGKWCWVSTDTAEPQAAGE
jgi:hypothetical protein